MNTVEALVDQTNPIATMIKLKIIELNPHIRRNAMIIAAKSNGKMQYPKTQRD